jgi:predicted amidohydrolase YtcJ
MSSGSAANAGQARVALHVTLFVLLVWYFTFTAVGEAAPDLVLLNGNIHTVDPTHPSTQAVAVMGKRIGAVGTTEQIGRLIELTTEVIDLHGRAAYPGLKDSHAHLLSLGLLRLRVNLTDARNFEEVIATVRRAAESVPKATWIIGRGLHEGKWIHKPADAVRGFPVHRRLSMVTPDHPVVLERADGHALLANPRAMELMHITRHTQSPPGGRISSRRCWRADRHIRRR